MRRAIAVEDPERAEGPAEADPPVSEPERSDRGEEELIMHLERDQFVAATSQPVALAPLGARARLGLWALRIFVVLVSIMVLYTFVDRLH